MPGRSRELRSRMRIDAFLAKKKKESAIAATCNQTGNPVTSKTVSGSESDLSQISTEPPVTASSVFADVNIPIVPSAAYSVISCAESKLSGVTSSQDQSPVAHHTRSRSRNSSMKCTEDHTLKPEAGHKVKMSLKNDNEDLKESNKYAPVSISTSRVAHIYSNTEISGSSHVDLKLSTDLSDSVTKHHDDFVKCMSIDIANEIKNCMERQWSQLVFPGRKVNVRVNDDIFPAVVQHQFSFP